MEAFGVPRAGVALVAEAAAVVVVVATAAAAAAALVILEAGVLAGVFAVVLAGVLPAPLPDLGVSTDPVTLPEGKKGQIISAKNNHQKFN